MKRRILLLFTIISALVSAASAQQDNLEFMDYNAPKLYVLKDIRMEGAKSLSPEILIMSSGMNIGDTVYIPGPYITDATKKLWSQSYFSDIRSEVEFLGGNDVALIFYLTERPRVFDWKLTGVSKTEETDLLEKLALRPGTTLSDFRINSSVDAIVNYLRSKSFMNATVDVVQGMDSLNDNAVTVSFNVNKGHKVKIGVIEFAGNTVFTDRQLRKTLKKTKQKNLNIFANTKYNEEKYTEDKVNLIDFYNSKGYRNAAITSDSIYSVDGERLGIRINVEEGIKFYYRNITWMGNSKLTSAQLDELLGISSGDTYDNKLMGEQLGVGKNDNPDDETTVTSIYQNDGYLAFEIIPEEIVVGEDSIDVEMKIYEGEQFTVNRVIISGNERVNDQVIRRQLDVLPGELYNRSLLMSSIRYLAAMDYFNPEALQPGFEPVSDNLVDITFPLEEKASDRFEISGGVGGDMFVGSVAVTLTNISMRDIFKKEAWKPFPVGAGQQLSISGQSNGSYYKAFSLGFTEPWLGGKKPISFNTSAYYSEQSNAYYAWQEGDKHFRTLGLSVGVGRRLKWPDWNFTLYHEFMYQSYRLKDWDYFIIQNGNSNILALKTTLERNTLDQPFYPRTGAKVSLSVTLTPPYSLFDGKDYKNPNLSDNERYKWIEYHKWHALAQWFVPVSTDNKLVFMAKAEAGFIGNYNNYKPSPFEGYQMGGDGMSGYSLYGVDIIGLRGYPNSSITPYNTYSRAYHKYTMELRYPFMFSPMISIYGLAFAEGGNAFDRLKHFDPFLLKRSLGLGLRLEMQLIGTIGVDWGYGFDRTVTTNERGGGNFAFSMGQEF